MIKTKKQYFKRIYLCSGSCFLYGYYVRDNIFRLVILESHITS